MHHFYSMKDYDGTYHIECLFTVYRERFGHHPDFLPQNEEDGKRDGFNTKFYYLIAEGLSKEEAEKQLAELYNKYDKLLYAIENDDKLWNTFPFKDMELVYMK